MDLLKFVREFILDKYPTSGALFQWRSNASLAAVALLQHRVNAGQVDPVRHAIEYLTGLAPAHDAQLAALAPIEHTTAFGSEGRLWSLLLDVRAGLSVTNAGAAGFTHRSQITPIWTLSTIVLTGVRATDDLDTIGWLSYFYKEKRGFTNLSEADKGRVLDFLNAFYVRPPQLDLHGSGTRLQNTGAANTHFQNNTLQLQMDGPISFLEKVGTLDTTGMSRAYKARSFILREALEALLRSGFVPVAECDDHHEISGRPQDAVLQEYNAWGDLNTTRARVQAALAQVPAVSYGWRGDSRTVGEIQGAGGLWCKAASEAYAKAKGMRAEWHPFHERSIRKYLYFRCGQSDNCLYTAVSVTPAVTSTGPANNPQFQFTNFDNNACRINICFPQLEEIPMAKRKRVRIDLERNTDNAAFSTDCFVDEVRLYLCKLGVNKWYVDTRAIQNSLNPGQGFPEIAVRGISSADLMAYLVLIRVHHGADNPAGFTAIPVANKSQNLNPGNPQVAALYNAANVQFEGAWGPNGILAPVPASAVWAGRYTIKQVKLMTVDAGGRIPMYQDY